MYSFIYVLHFFSKFQNTFMFRNFLLSNLSNLKYLVNDSTDLECYDLIVI